MFCKFLPVVFLLFFFQLSFLACSAMCKAANAHENAETPKSPFPIFAPTTTQFAKKNAVGDGGKTITYESFTSPSLSYVEGVLIVFAHAKHKANDNTKCDIVEGYFKIESDGSLAEKDETDTAEPKWKKQVTANEEKRCAGDPTFAVNTTDIFLFFKNSSDTGDNNIEYWIKGGKIDKIGTQSGITWKSSINLMKEPKPLTEEPNKISSVSSGGSGIIVNGTFVIPVWYTDSKKNNLVSVITNTSHTDGEKWELFISTSPVEGKYPVIVKWENKLIMLITKKEGYRKVYESTEIKKEWTEAVGSLSAMWEHTNKDTEGKYNDRNNLITAVFDKDKKKKVMLFTKLAKKGENYELHLWMSDYQRVYDVGEISADVEQNITSTLLYTGDKLFAAYEKWEDNKSSINAVYLKEKPESVKTILDKWIEQDEKLLKSCFTENLSLTTSEGCLPKISIDGLVGFLSDNDGNEKWVDKYLCVDATVNDKPTVTNVTNGMKFSGIGAGAKWLVNAQGQKQRYYFSNLGFTLVATVKIDGDTDENKNSILGIRFGESSTKNSIGVWCNNGKWSISNTKERAEEIPTTKTCVKEGIYQVALILKNKNFNVYIGEKKGRQNPDTTITAQQPLSITYFYFGVDNDAETSSATQSHVTVTNVLLYNRPFDENKIKNLKEYVKPPKAIKNQDENKDTGTQGGDIQTSPSLPQSSDENVPSPSRTEDGAVGGGVRVFSLLLAVLRVSAPLLHL